MHNGDIRGYQDPNCLRVHVGRRGTLEDGQVEAVEVAADVGPGDDVTKDVLWNETREQRDGTGETWRTLSWIWTTESHSGNPEDDGDNILWVEWAKSRVRAARCHEEVLLLREEMHRVLAFLEWKSSWWLEHKNSRMDVASDLAEGLRAYAETQSDLQQSLKVNFREIWKSPLANAHAQDDNGNGEDNGEARDNDDEDDEDDVKGGVAEGTDEEGSDTVDN